MLTRLGTGGESHAIEGHVGLGLFGMVEVLFVWFEGLRRKITLNVAMFMLSEKVLAHFFLLLNLSKNVN